MILSRPRMRQALHQPWITNILLIALGTGLLCMTRQFVSENDHYTIGVAAVWAWSTVFYIGAVVVVLSRPADRWSFPIILGFAIACRLVLLFAEPFLSSDAYRYVWDGAVQHAGINPYRYVPGDAALTFLREANQDSFNSMNRRDYARTIYPPAAQMIYYAVTWISPTLTMMKVAMVGFECISVAALVDLLKRMGRPREQALLYAWSPLAICEVASSGHIDAAVIAFMLLAFVFRWRDRALLAGLFLGLAIMTKFYPIVLVPALYRRGDWKLPAAILAVVAAGYAVYASAGRSVFGFLAGYTREEGIATGARYFLLQLAQSLPGFAHPSPTVYLVCSGLMLLALTWWAMRSTSRESALDPLSGSPPKFLRAAALLALALMLLFSPHYAWYVLWLVPMFSLWPSLSLLTYLAGVFYLLTTPISDGAAFAANEKLYAALACSFLLDLLIRRSLLSSKLARFFRETTLRPNAEG